MAAAFGGLLSFLVPVAALRATGEIAQVRAPESIAEGDDITIAVSATERETNIDRVLALEYPDTWQPRHAWRVEAGATKYVELIPDPEIQSLFPSVAGRKTLALGDYIGEFDPDAQGMVYFVTFHTKASVGPPGTATVKATLVERTNPDAPRELDPKTHRPKPIMADWRMTFPMRYDFSFSAITAKHLMATVRMERELRAARALVAFGHANATASLHTRPEAVRSFFARPFSLGFWVRTASPDQNFLLLRFGNGGALRIGTGLLGQPVLGISKGRDLLFARGLLFDGAWHHIMLSKDSANKLRFFFDAQPPAMADAPKNLFGDISSISIGDSAANNDFAIDELRLLHQAFRDPSEFERTIAWAARDTMRSAFALFHFDDAGSIARSSTPVTFYPAGSSKGELIPMFFALDSGTMMIETNSPVQLDPVMLTADLVSPTQVHLHWKTTSEIGVHQFRIERRIGSFGPFEKVLVVDAKHGLKSAKRGSSIVSINAYSANEELPKLSGDIDLFYRLAILGFNEKEPPAFSQPVKLEYGADREAFVEQNQPNPFNPTTQIAFRTEKAMPIRLSVFDMIGREVAVLANGKLEPGRHVYSLDATNWPGGIYFYKVKTPRSTITRKMVLAK